MLPESFVHYSKCKKKYRRNWYFLAIVNLQTQNGTRYQNPTLPHGVFSIIIIFNLKKLNLAALISFAMYHCECVHTERGWWISSGLFGWTWSGSGLLPRLLNTGSDPAIAISLSHSASVCLSLSPSGWQKATGSRCQLPWEQCERCRKWPSIPPHFLRSDPWLLVLDGALPELHAINMH